MLLFLIGVFRCYRSLGQSEKAIEYLNLAVELRRKFGPRIGEAATLNMLGVVYDDLGNDTQALEWLEKALVIRQEVGHREGEAITLHNIGAT